MYTHYMHSVVVQDVVSGRGCCMNQYDYESPAKITTYSVD